MTLTRRSFLQAVAGVAGQLALLGPLAVRAPERESIWLRTDWNGPSKVYPLTDEVLDAAFEAAQVRENELPRMVFFGPGAEAAYRRALS